jgi:hypothetical protein
MAVISFTDDITRQNDLDTSATFGTIGGGPGAAIITAMRYQGTAAAARRINASNTDHGFTITEGTTRDTTTAAFRTFFFKGFLKQRGDLNSNGVQLRLGSTTSDYHLWIVGDDGTIEDTAFFYQLAGGFILKPVDATLSAWRYSTTGTPDETAVDIYAITANVSATANGEDLALDSLDWIENGFYMVGGDGADADGTFQDFVDEDQGGVSTTVDNTGLWSQTAGVIFFYGGNSIGVNASGTATATAFTDSFVTVVCPGGYVREGFNALKFNTENASTVISLSNVTIIGQGREGTKFLIDTAATPNGAIDTINDDITITSHGMKTGQQVLYDQESGTGTVVSLTGGDAQLVTGASGPYYYVINVDVDTIALATSIPNAVAGTRVALSTATGIHSLTRAPDTRPDIIVTGAPSSGSIDFTDCTLQSMRNIELSDNSTITRGSIVSSQKLLINSGTLSEVSIVSPSVWSGESFLSASDLENISGCSFTSDGAGHAIEIDTAGTYTFSANTFTSYGPASSTFLTDATGIDAATEVITTDESHAFIDGDLVYYSDEGGVASIGLTDQALYYVNSISSTTLSLHASKYNAENDVSRINLTVSGAETHALYSADAAIFNNSGGAVTINITNDGNTPTVRNSAGSSTTVNNTKTLTITNIYPDSEIRLYSRDDTTNEFAGSESVVGELQSATITNGGSGYSVSDVLTISGGTFSTAAQVTVDSVDGSGSITSISITTVGSYTSPPSAVNEPTGGLGVDAVLSINVSGIFSYVYNYTVDIPLTIVVFSLVRKDLRLNTISLTNTNQSIPIQQQLDRVYSNP